MIRQPDCGALGRLPESKQPAGKQASHQRSVWVPLSRTPGKARKRQAGQQQAQAGQALGYLGQKMNGAGTCNE
jgi:hypothetical protein